MTSPIQHLLINGEQVKVRTRRSSADDSITYEVATGDGEWVGVACDVRAVGAQQVSLLLPDGKSIAARLDTTPLGTELVLGQQRFTIASYDPRSLTARRSATAAHSGPLTLTSPMPGRIVRILQPAGAPVAAKQGVLMVEAMKMQNEIKTPRAGEVQSILVAEGDSVVAGQALAVIA